MLDIIRYRLLLVSWLIVGFDMPYPYWNSWQSFMKSGLVLNANPADEVVPEEQGEKVVDNSQADLQAKLDAALKQLEQQSKVISELEGTNSTQNIGGEASTTDSQFRSKTQPLNVLDNAIKPPVKEFNWDQVNSSPLEHKISDYTPIQPLNLIDFNDNSIRAMLFEKLDHVYELTVPSDRRVLLKEHPIITETREISISRELIVDLISSVMQWALTAYANVNDPKGRFGYSATTIAITTCFAKYLIYSLRLLFYRHHNLDIIEAQRGNSPIPLFRFLFEIYASTSITSETYSFRIANDIITVKVDTTLNIDPVIFSTKEVEYYHLIAEAYSRFTSSLSDEVMTGIMLTCGNFAFGDSLLEGCGFTGQGASRFANIISFMARDYRFAERDPLYMGECLQRHLIPMLTLVFPHTTSTVDAFYPYNDGVRFTHYLGLLSSFSVTESDVMYFSRNCNSDFIRRVCNYYKLVQINWDLDEFFGFISDIFPSFNVQIVKEFENDFHTHFTHGFFGKEWAVRFDKITTQLNFKAVSKDRFKDGKVDVIINPYLGSCRSSTLTYTNYNSRKIKPYTDVISSYLKQINQDQDTITSTEETTSTDNE